MRRMVPEERSARYRRLKQLLSDGNCASDERNGVVRSDSLPRQPNDQGIELRALELQLVTARVHRPEKPDFIEPPRAQPQAKAVMHQHFDPVGTAVGKQDA